MFSENNLEDTETFAKESHIIMRFLRTHDEFVLNKERLTNIGDTLFVMSCSIDYISLVFGAFTLYITILLLLLHEYA